MTLVFQWFVHGFGFGMGLCTSVVLAALAAFVVVAASKETPCDAKKSKGDD